MSRRSTLAAAVVMMAMFAGARPWTAGWGMHGRQVVRAISSCSRCESGGRQEVWSCGAGRKIGSR